MNVKSKNFLIATVLVCTTLQLAAPTAKALELEAQLQMQESYLSESQGQIDRAISQLIPLYNSSADDYLLNLRLGWLFYLDHKYKNSIDHYSKAAKIAPNSVEALLGLSQALATAGDWSQLVNISQEILKLDGHNYLGRQRLVQALLKLKKYPLALQESNEALKAYPADAVFLEQKGFALQQLGQRDEARAVLTTLLLVSPKNYYARSTLGTTR